MAEPNIGIIIQARTNSERLPEKVLCEVNGKPLIQYVLERAYQCKGIQEVILATSLENSDDRLCNFCKDNHHLYYRGSLNDVASRFNEISKSKKWDAFVRINGDSPLLDHHLIEKGIELYTSGDFDIITNVFLRSYPHGQSVEVINTDTFDKVKPRMTEPADLEHVTGYFYRNSKDFKILNFVSQNDYSHYRLSVDTYYDLKVFTNLLHHMTKPHEEYYLEEIISIYQQTRGLSV